jgi:hypothetical protein
VRSARAGQRCPGVDEWVQAELDLPGGATASLLTHMAGPEQQMRLVLTGTRGQLEAPCFVLPQLDERLLVTTGAAERHEWVTGPSSYVCQLTALDVSARRALSNRCSYRVVHRLDVSRTASTDGSTRPTSV